MNLGWILIVKLLGLTLLIKQAFSITVIYNDEINLKPGYYINFKTHLKKGDSLILYWLELTGYDINVYITDQTSKVLMFWERYKANNTYFVAEKTDYYYIFFDNSYSLVTPKRLYIKLVKLPLEEYQRLVNNFVLLTEELVFNLKEKILNLKC